MIDKITKYKSRIVTTRIFTTLFIVLAGISGIATILINLEFFSSFLISVASALIFMFLWLYNADKYSYYKLLEIGNRLKKKVKS